MPDRTILRWEEPRPKRAGVRATQDSYDTNGGVWREVADDLRAKQGDWAVLSEGDHKAVYHSLSAAIRFGTLLDFRPALTFDATVRHDRGWYTLYARYVGDEDWGPP